MISLVWITLIAIMLLSVAALVGLAVGYWLGRRGRSFGELPY